MLPHTHVQSSGFVDFLHEILPGYELKSARTVKRTLLKMYVVVRQSVINYLTLEYLGEGVRGR